MKVSIIIPTYNRPALLQRAVASALIACPSDGEMIVVDDRSDTAVKALEAVAGDPRLRICTNTGDKGAAGARNHGIALALGEILMFLDDDDVIVADYPKRVTAAAREGEADWGFARLATIERITTPLESAIRNNKPHWETGLVDNKALFFEKVFGFSFGFWIRKPTFQRIGLISTDLTLGEDSDYFLRLYGHFCPAWFESEPGCILTTGYPIVSGDAPQLTRSIDSETGLNFQLRIVERNQTLFGVRSPQRWFLIRTLLRDAAFKGVDKVPKELIRDLYPLDWRLRAWLFWQMKKRGKRIRERRLARKSARS